MGSFAPRKCVLTIFGTRPELIKLAPVIHGLRKTPARFRTVIVNTGQHEDLVQPLVREFEVRIDHELRVMKQRQTPNQVCARILAALDPILVQEKPNLVLVQGDTTTALAGALAAFNQGVPVGHVEAGLRSGDMWSPFPEEMNRRLVTRLSSYHFAATPRNREALIAEGIESSSICVTGNPIVDALRTSLEQLRITIMLSQTLQATRNLKRIVLTTHRRESFGTMLTRNLEVLRDFVQRHDDVALILPVHPNPAVRDSAEKLLSGHLRIHLLDPLNYGDFIGLLSQAWLIVSDSGGIQEEAPTLGKPLIVLRDKTERPEAIEAGIARLTHGDPAQLEALLEEAYQDGLWLQDVTLGENPFGKGDSGEQIVQAIARLLGVEET
jgi:UDP-N-acetylglucosamine 2-epimerase (non-hydrolysing)